MDVIAQEDLSFFWYLSSCLWSIILDKAFLRSYLKNVENLYLYHEKSVYFLLIYNVLRGWVNSYKTKGITSRIMLIIQ